jgi:glycosyltransferase involved in cell wall biosynthesis
VRSSDSRRNYVFLSQRIDNTGAPLVLLEIIEELASIYSSAAFRVLAPEITENQRKRLDAVGVKIGHSSSTFGRRSVHDQLDLAKNTFLLLNTVAVPENYQQFVLGALERQHVDHAFWLVHENTSQLAFMAPRMLESKKRIAAIRELIDQGRITFLAPSKEIQRQYRALFDTENIKLLTYNIRLDERYCASRRIEEYQALRFLLVGPAPDGRKAQMIAMTAFSEFLQTAYRSEASGYREFSVTLLPLGDDYVSRQIRTIGRTALGERLKWYPAMSHAKVLDLVRECNVTLCCSFEEAFPISVAEGMSMGHVLLRNEVGGLEEQLATGENGYYIDATDIGQFAHTLEEILNRKKTPDDKLHAMGLASQERIAPYRNNAYASRLKQLEEDALNEDATE